MKIIGILILVGGIYLLSLGFSKRDSVEGHMAATGDKIANSFDGGNRQPAHVGYIAGGAAMVLAGAFLALRRGAAP